jgi:hypothetical protein
LLWILLSVAICPPEKIGNVPSVPISSEFLNRQVLQSAAKPNMDVYRQELNRLHHELVATLTPKQRQLLTVGGLTPEMCTPQQLEILKKMDPYLEGLNLQQVKNLAVLDTFAEGYEKGQESGRRLVKMMVIIFFITLGLLALFVR